MAGLPNSPPTRALASQELAASLEPALRTCDAETIDVLNKLCEDRPVTREDALALVSNDKTSIFFLVRSLLHYRREHAPLSQGEWRLLSPESDVLAYQRRNGDDRIFVVLNFTADSRAWSAPTATKARVAISTHGDRRGESVGSTLSLRANEGLLIEPA